MFKAIALLALVVCAFAADPLMEVKSIIRNDQCGIQGLENLRPKIEEQVSILKQSPENAAAKAELLALMEEAKTVYDECGMTKKVEPVLGDAIKAAGIGFLLASNCSKDVGMVLLILDQVIQDHSEIMPDVILSIFLYILGRQAVADCEQFIHFVW